MQQAQWPYKIGALNPLPERLPSGKAWPRISIVTPSLNQAEYIEETILSVAQQGYPDLEYIVIDGGSTDGTKEILQRYSSQISYWVSEKDDGQSDAINKGLARTTGKILAWLNSDDRLAPGALASIAIAYDLSGADLFAGICELFNESGVIMSHLTACASGPLSLDDFVDSELVRKGFSFYQPEVMFTRDLWERTGAKVDQTLTYVMDYELWLRFAAVRARIEILGRPIAQFRVHPAQKTHGLTARGVAAAKHRKEVKEVRARYAKKSSSPSHFPLGRTGRHGPLKVLGLNDLGYQDGAGIAHRRGLESISLAGHDIRVATLTEELNFSPLPGRSLAKVSRGVHAFPKICDDVTAEKYDLIFAGNIHAATRSADVLARLSASTPVVVVLHDLFLLTGRCGYPGTCKKYLTRCDASCPTKAEYPALEPSSIAYQHGVKRSWLDSDTAPLLLANSDWTRRVASVAIANDTRAKLANVILGFPTHLFRPREKKSLRQRLGLPISHTVIAFAASTVAHKGSAELFRLFRSISREGISFLCMGRLENPEDLNGLSNVVTTGLILEEWKVAEWLAAADIYVTASRRETFGQTVVEAALCGVPAVAYRETGLASAIIDGVSGILVEPRDRDGLKRALIRLISDVELRQSMAVWGRIALEYRRSYAACYHSIHRALIHAKLLDPVGIRFVPQFASTWHTDDKLSAEASDACRPKLLIRSLFDGVEVSQQKAGLVSTVQSLDRRAWIIETLSAAMKAFGEAGKKHHGPIVRIGRMIARFLFPEGRPVWISRFGSTVQKAESIYWINVSGAKSKDKASRAPHTE